MSGGPCSWVALHYATDGWPSVSRRTCSARQYERLVPLVHNVVYRIGLLSSPARPPCCDWGRLRTAPLARRHRGRNHRHRPSRATPTGGPSRTVRRQRAPHARRRWPMAGRRSIRTGDARITVVSNFDHTSYQRSARPLSTNAVALAPAPFDAADAFRRRIPYRVGRHCGRLRWPSAGRDAGGSLRRRHCDRDLALLIASGGYARARTAADCAIVARRSRTCRPRFAASRRYSAFLRTRRLKAGRSRSRSVLRHLTRRLSHRPLARAPPVDSTANY